MGCEATHHGREREKTENSFSGFIPLVVPRKGFSPHIPASRLFVFFHPTQPHPCKPHQIKQPQSKIAVFLSINESALPPPQPSSVKNVPITRGNVPKKHTFPRLIGIFPLYPFYLLGKKMGCGISLKDTTAFYGLLSTLERLNGGRW